MIGRKAALAAILLLAPLTVRAAEAPTGATACSGCHAASANVDTPVPPLAGRHSLELYGALLAFKTGQRQGTIMDRIAKGFTDEELKAIAEWYGAQKE